VKTKTTARGTVLRMALSKEEADLLRRHLAKYTFPCPICGKKTWSIDGPVVLLKYDMNLKTAVPTSGGIPLVVLTCLTCWFVREFAWRPILREQVSFELPPETEDADG
jgi:hypothetical protein